MREISVTEFGSTATIEGINFETLNQQVKSFLTFLGYHVNTYEPILTMRFIAVYSFCCDDASSLSNDNGWVVGGNVPFLQLDDHLIKTPVEALAMYAWFLQPWLDAKGIDDPPGSIADYRLAPDWDFLDFNTTYESSKLGAIQNLISWNMLAQFQDELTSPEVRHRCELRGWIKGRYRA